MFRAVHEWKVWEFEIRALFVTTIATLVSMFVIVISAITNRWVNFVLETKKGELLIGHQGLWKISYYSQDSQINQDYVIIHLFEDQHANDTDTLIATLLRTSIAFVGFSLLLMILSNIFGVYTLKHPRFTFKRVSGALYALTTICLIVCIDVYVRILTMESQNQKLIKYPIDEGNKLGYVDQAVVGGPIKRSMYIYVKVNSWSMGFSLISMIMITVVYGLASLMFFFYSKKLKGQAAPSTRIAEENEEYLIGRV